MQGFSAKIQRPAALQRILQPFRCGKMVGAALDEQRRGGEKMTRVKITLRPEERKLVLKSRKLDISHRNDFFSAANIIIDTFLNLEHGGGRAVEQESRFNVERHGNVAVVHCPAWRHAGRK